MSSADRETALAGELIERLLVDPEFRAEFRRDPAAACLAAGLPELAEELAGSGRSMDTLVIRESRSSLAGVVMAVAVEGMSVTEAQALMHHGLTGAPRGKLPHGGALRSPLGHIHHPASPVALRRELSGLRGGSVRHGMVGGGGGGAVPAGGGGGGGAASAAGGSGVVSTGESASAPGTAGGQAGAGAMSAPPEPGAQPAHGGPLSAWPDERGGGGGGAVGGAGVAVGEAGGGAGATVEGMGGAAGTGVAVDPTAGSVGAAASAMLDTPRLSASANVRAFLTGGGADRRMVSVLDTALANHTIELGPVEAVSDPVHVQAIDIVAVDGQPVGPENFAARDLVTEIAALDPSVRPSEIGTPWPIQSQGFFSDGGEMNRLHLAFEMPGADSPPAGAATPAVGVAGAPVGGQVAYAAPAAGQLASPGVLAGGGDPASLSSAVPAPIAADTQGSGPDAALAYAHSMIGKLPESAGNNLGPQLDKFEADFGFHGAAWCGIFAGHVLEAAGLQVPHSVASVASILDLARNGDPPFVKGVLPVSEARPGDLVTFGGTEHVAVVTKVDSAGVHTIAGNTSQSNVSETTYSPSSVTGVVRPDYAAGKPGSIPGVWDYSGAQPPAANVPASTPVESAAGGGMTPAAELDSPAAAARQPGTQAFKAPGGHGPVRSTVQFLPAIKPNPESPLYGQVQEPTSAGLQEPAPAGMPEQVADQAAAAVPTGGSVTVDSSLLTPGQAKFAGRLAELTGLDPRVVAAWELAEESGSAAQGREAASNFNWLNIGYFDSGAGRIAFDQTFSDPVSAAEQSAKFLKGEWGGASPSIRSILNTVGHSPDEQMAAIANSDWASSHYGGGANLHGTYNELGDIQVENTNAT